MAKAPSIEDLLKRGSKEWNTLKSKGAVPMDHTGATFAQLFSANADLSGVTLIGTEWEKCDLSKVSFKDADLKDAINKGKTVQKDGKELKMPGTPEIAGEQLDGLVMFVRKLVKK